MCPTSSTGRDTESVRVIRLAIDGCENSSKSAAKSSLARETGSVMDTQSSCGETTEKLRPFVAANDSNAATVVLEG
jgi:hypothetical protein